MSEEENAEEKKEEVEAGESADKKETKVPKVKAPSVYNIKKFERQKVGKLSMPMVSLKTDSPPEPGRTIKLKLDGGSVYKGKVDECVEIDGRYCVTFVEGVQPA